MQPQTTPSRTWSWSLAPILFIGILVMFLAGLGTLLLVRGIKTIQPIADTNRPVVQPVALPLAAQPVPPPKPQPVPQPAVVATRPTRPIVNTSVVVTIPVRGTLAQETAEAKITADPVLAAKPEAIAVARTEATAGGKVEKTADVTAEKANSPLPILKLQGIYYRRTNPSAMINGHGAFVGDEVDGARVVAIERTSVVVEVKGEKQVLHLP
jgi:hypothetical protein